MPSRGTEISPVPTCGTTRRRAPMPSQPFAAIRSRSVHIGSHWFTIKKFPGKTHPPFHPSLSVKTPPFQPLPQNLRPFPPIQLFHFVPLCSALFRQNFFFRTAKLQLGAFTPIITPNFPLLIQNCPIFPIFDIFHLVSPRSATHSPFTILNSSFKKLLTFGVFHIIFHISPAGPNGALTFRKTRPSYPLRFRRGTCASPRPLRFYWER